MDKYAVFLDIDNTLAFFDDFPNGGTVSAENARAIDEARRLGHYVFINTGRSYAWINRAVLAAVNVDGVISGIGTQVLYNGEAIFEKMIDRDALRKVLEAVYKSGSFVLLGGTDAVYIMNSDGEGIQNDPIFFSSPDEFFEKYPDAKIQKAELFAPDEASRKVLDEAMHAFHHPTYSEGCPRGVTKASAMLFAAKRLGIPAERCIAMGDSINDMDMLSAAGISVAMGDADERVREMADFVSLPCAEDGVAYAMRKLLPGM